MTLRAEIPTEIQNDTGYNIVTACFGVVIFLSLVGNVLLFIVYYRNKCLRDLSTVLIVQMSVSNLLYTIIELAFVIIKGMRLQVSTLGCKVFVYVNGVARASSSLLLLAVSIERSTAICSPTLCYSMRKIPAMKTKIFVTAWTIALFLHLGMPSLACDPAKVSPGYRIAVVLITYIIPFFVELSAYMAAYRKIALGLRSPERSRYLLLFLKKSLNVFALIEVIFAICVLPPSAVTIIKAFGYKDPVGPLTYYMLDMIEAVPCATNVICYLACSPKFRQEIMNLFLPSRGQENVELDPCNAQRFRPRSINAGVQNSGRASDERGGNEDRALRNATRRLDWIFGDDPSEIIVHATGPDTPLGNLKDLSLAMTLEMACDIHTIPEDSESTEIPERREIKHAGPRSSTWPRRGNSPIETIEEEVRNARNIHADGKGRNRFLRHSTESPMLKIQGTSSADPEGAGCGCKKAVQFEGLTKL